MSAKETSRQECYDLFLEKDTGDILEKSASVLSSKDEDEVVARYQNRIRNLGVTFEALNSGTPSRQRARHAVHASVVVQSGSSVLDIGCGLGEFYQFLLDSGFTGTYTGYDIVPEFITACSEMYPSAAFEVRNVFTSGIGGIFDSVVMSQVFNNRYRESMNMEVLAKALSLGFAHCRQAVSVDMMSSYVDYQNDDLYYYSPEEVFRIARSAARRVILRHDYRPFEFCVQLFHDDYPGFAE